MTSLGAALLLGCAFLVALWILDLVRRGQLYVGYGIVLLVLIVAIAGIATVPVSRGLATRFLASLYPYEPIAVVGLAGVLLLLVYVLHQLSVLSDRVATLTQQIALRQAGREKDEA